MDAKRRQFKPQSDHETRMLAQATIDAQDWIRCVNVPLHVIVNIERNLIRQFANAAGVSEIEAVPEIARLVVSCRNRLRRYALGQIEYLLENPVKATWHIMVNDGEYWISDHEFWPYF